MELVIALEHRFVRTPDGAIRTATAHARTSWERFLRVFERVRVVARVHELSASDPLARDGAWQRLPRADGDGVRFAPLPAYVGPREYLRQRGALRRAVRAVDVDDAAVLLRVPGMAGSLLSRALPAAQPFGVEVISDPAEALAKGAIEHPLRPLFRAFFRAGLRRLCRRAACALYVTERALQQRYPPGPGTFAVAASDVELGEDAFAADAAAPEPAAGGLRLISVAMLEQPYKRQDDLLRALALCVSAGVDARLTIAGDGKLRPSLERLAASLGLADRVDFRGALPGGAAVRAALDAHQLFVLPSQTEGTPRALLEAMARGLPCIATAVGGVPELLPRYALVPPRDVEALAARIVAFAREPALRARARADNLAAARCFRESELTPLREQFLRELRARTLAAQAARRRRPLPRREALSPAGEAS